MRTPRRTKNPYELSDYAQALSGVVQLPVPVLGVPLNWRQVCAWNPAERVVPVPCVVCVEVEQDQGFSSTNQWQFQRGEPYYFVGPRFGNGLVNGDWNQGINQGAIRLRYGAEGMQRVRIMDLKSGNFQLPPVQNVEVSVDVYPGQEPLLPQWPVTVRACIVPCESHPNPTEPTYTGVQLPNVADVAHTAQWAHPPGARGFRWWYGGDVLVTAVLTGQALTEAPPVHPGTKFFDTTAAPTVFDAPTGIDYLTLPAAQTGLPIVTFGVTAVGTLSELGAQCVLAL